MEARGKNEIVVQGISASQGIAYGQVFLYIQSDVEIPSYQVDADKRIDEISRFEHALLVTRQQIQKIQSEVSRANVDLVAVLDEQELSLGDVAGFAVGRVLGLRATPDGLLRVECNGEPLINCEIGKANGVYALRVRDFIDQEKEFMEDILAS